MKKGCEMRNSVLFLGAFIVGIGGFTRVSLSLTLDKVIQHVLECNPKLGFDPHGKEKLRQGLMNLSIDKVGNFRVSEEAVRSVLQDLAIQHKFIVPETLSIECDSCYSHCVDYLKSNSTCEHLFCELCLVKWFAQVDSCKNNKNTCLMCRAPFHADVIKFLKLHHLYQLAHEEALRLFDEQQKHEHQQAEDLVDNPIPENEYRHPDELYALQMQLEFDEEVARALEQELNQNRNRNQVQNRDRENDIKGDDSVDAELFDEDDKN